MTRVPAVNAAAAPDTRPTVVFADLEPWEGFLQFAAALRCRGVRVERLTSLDRSRVRRFNDLLQRLVFQQTRPVISRSPDGSPIGEQLLGYLPARMEAVEAVDVVAASLLAADLLPRRTSAPELEPLLVDKLAMMQHAAAHGLAVPRSWPAEAECLAILPFVVKPRLGSGGAGVEVVRDEAIARSVGRRARQQRGELLCQEWAPGELVHVGGVARDGNVLQAACYRAVGSPHAPFGPSAQVLTIDDRETLAEAHGLMRSLGYNGAFCLDYVRDASGRALLVDVNARIFGSWASLQSAGLDLVGAYLNACGLSAAPPPTSLPPGLRLRVLPPDMSLDSPQGMLRVIAAHLRGVADGTRILGWRWSVSTTCRLLCSAVVRIARAAAHRSERLVRRSLRTGAVATEGSTP